MPPTRSARAPRRTMWLLPAIAVLGGVLVTPGAAASTVSICTLEPAYEACGRAFPDPQAGLGLDPHEEGLLPATAFIQFGRPDAGPSEIWDGLKLLERRYDRFLEVWTLEEFLDDPGARSAGLWLAGQRVRSPLILARVTDETVPPQDKARFFFGLSLHGIERAGAEGGTRALEDLVTYAHCESLGSLEAAQADPICRVQTQVERGPFAEGEGGFPARLLFWDEDSLTMGQALKHTELYFGYVNPDGWHRGDLPASGGIGHYQRYNGNGIDPNRDWPTQGYTYRPYKPGSEPETDAFSRALRSIEGEWAGGLDLHGMTTAPVLTYTMLPAGQHDYRKNARLRVVAERTQQDAFSRLGWSVLIEGGEGPGVVDVPIFGPIVAMGPQQWGTVWDTIDYTITGALGDWLGNPSIGLGGLGMGNEMALSHITNCGIGSCFIPDIEQLHVAGNKGLIYSQIDTTLRTMDTPYRFPFASSGAYVRHDKVVSAPAAPRAFGAKGLEAQAMFAGQVVCAAVSSPFAGNPTSCESTEFDVLGPEDGVHNGGIAIDVGFAAPHATNDETGGRFILQRFVVDHDDEGEWEDVARNETAGQLYLPNGQTIAHNDPVPGRYRIAMRPSTPGPYFYEVRFAKRSAYEDPGQLPYRATNLDFFDELGAYLPARHRLRALEAADVIRDPSLLGRYRVIVLADEALPGWDHSAPRRSVLSRAQKDRYYRALARWVRGGGTLVMTDAALQGLADLMRNDALTAEEIKAFAGFAQFRDQTGAVTYGDPLARGIDVPGAAEGSGNRRQTYEPVPLGFHIGTGFIPQNQHSAPIWILPRDAFLEAGGRVIGQAGSGVALGELSLGKGSVRVAGGLLPTPTDAFDHPFGLASYALTHTGWQLFENLITVGISSPEQPRGSRVLSERRELPATGQGAAWALGMTVVALAAAAGRRSRRTR